LVVFLKKNIALFECYSIYCYFYSLHDAVFVKEFLNKIIQK